MYEVVQAGLGDLTALMRLEAVCFKQDAWPIWDLVGILILPSTVHFKAVVGEKMAGFAGGDTRLERGVGWIATIGVLPEFRRMGIATALLRQAERALAQPLIRLSVRRSNHGAFALYQREGYRLGDVWRGYYANGEDALVLEKKME